MLPTRLRKPRSGLDHALQRADGAFLVAWLVHRRLCDESAMLESGVVQQAAKRLRPDGPLPDVLMAIQPRPAGRLGIVAMPHPHAVKTDGRARLPHGFLVPRIGHNVISRDMCMAGIQA